jgi:formylglycine-generating enzyme required for sulfatase activity
MSDCDVDAKPAGAKQAASTHAETNLISRGTFRLGSNRPCREGPPADYVTLSGLCIDCTTVTNRQFVYQRNGLGEVRRGSSEDTISARRRHMLKTGSLMFTLKMF